MAEKSQFDLVKEQLDRIEGFIKKIAEALQDETENDGFDLNKK